jgi:hypothetical protein
MICYGSFIDELDKIASEKEAGIQYYRGFRGVLKQIPKSIQEAKKIGLPFWRGLRPGIREGWIQGKARAGILERHGAERLGEMPVSSMQVPKSELTTGQEVKGGNILPWWRKNPGQLRQMASGDMKPLPKDPWLSPPPEPEFAARPENRMPTGEKPGSDSKKGHGFGDQVLGGLATAGLIGVPLAAGWTLGATGKQEPAGYGQNRYYYGSGY